ncbi:7 transmembrane receptor [Dictyocaulus viviparus]|uniref:7 transmembrane receptor n=1 Tax=Dictyocaulus viviparus TaxID=29172 RepID=A0A0D8X9V9_DICVI|nr:7 transmembrane receptor [Dictyocaulus viviparus]
MNKGDGGKIVRNPNLLRNDINEEWSSSIKEKHFSIPFSVSYGASSPALSNRERFPTLFRTHPTANMQNPTRMRLFEKFRWKKVTILQSVEEVFTSTAKDLEELGRRRGIRVERQSFYGDPTDAMKTLRRQDARVIVGLFYVTEARKVLCQAYHHKLYGRKYTWFFIGWYADTWYIPPSDEHLNCTADQMAKAAQYHFTTESVMLSRDENATISGMTGKEFQTRLTAMLSPDSDPANTGGFPEAPLAYDALWALALAFNCTRNRLPPNIRLEQFTYDNQKIADILFECVKNTLFRGVSGKVMFSDSGDRIARTQIEQMQNGKYVVMGFYDTTTQELEWYGKEKWYSSKGPPPDSTIVRKSFLTVASHLYYSVAVFAFIGLGLALGAFIFNNKYSFRGIIVHSQPQCNNIMITGCSLCIASLFLMGLPSEGIALPRSAFPILCHSRISILMIGFTFAYGSMFAKVWIVHRMSANENQQLASRQKDEYKPLLSTYEDKEDVSPWDTIRTLIASVVGRQAFVAAELRKVSSNAYGTLAISRRINILNQEPTVGIDDDVMLLPILELCQSSQQEVWIGLVLGYKCLLLVFGLFLAYESRNLKLRYVNDSRLVGLAIYNVAILSLVTGPVTTLLIRGQPNANFAFVAVTVLLCTYISLGLVFVPKLRFICRVPPSVDEVCEHMQKMILDYFFLLNTSPLRCINEDSISTSEPERKALKARPNRSTMMRGMSKSDKKIYEHLKNENETLQKQIEEKEKRIRQCKERLDRLQHKKDSLSNSVGATQTQSVSVRDHPPLVLCVANNNYNGICVIRFENYSEDKETYSTPTTLTATALIEVQLNNESTGRYMALENDNYSSSSDEILL